MVVVRGAALVAASFVADNDDAGAAFLAEFITAFLPAGTPSPTSCIGCPRLIALAAASRATISSEICDTHTTAASAIICAVCVYVYTGSAITPTSHISIVAWTSSTATTSSVTRLGAMVSPSFATRVSIVTAASSTVARGIVISTTCNDVVKAACDAVRITITTIANRNFIRSRGDTFGTAINNFSSPSAA